MFGFASLRFIRNSWYNFFSNKVEYAKNIRLLFALSFGAETFACFNLFVIANLDCWIGWIKKYPWFLMLHTFGSVCEEVFSEF